MNDDYRRAQTRRIVTGIGEDGRSTVLRDDFTAQRVSAPAFTICDVWESPRLPVPFETDVPAGTVSIDPPKQGLVIRICTFPPDTAYDKAEYEQSLAALQGADTFRPDADLPGMHETKTLDVVTVVSGELHIVLETGETLLRQGDCIVMKGGAHSWSNKTDRPAVLCSVIMSAEA
jgi:mannose-6-phosphate isomerase-like protein (cupin superfamily)